MYSPNITMDFLSDTPWKALICSPWIQNGDASHWNCARNSVGLLDSFYRGRGQDTDAPHETEVKPRIAKACVTTVACTGSSGTLTVTCGAEQSPSSCLQLLSA
jgi:hypothetical protein